MSGLPLQPRTQTPRAGGCRPRGVTVDGWAEFFARQRERPPKPKRRMSKTLVGQLERRYIEERRAQIEYARNTGVTLEQRDGRIYRVLHLPAASNGTM
jgi:hypothetical protein